MTVAVDVVDEAGLLADYESVRGLLQAVFAAEGLSSGEVSVAFVDDHAIAALNWRYRATEGPTDVLAFDYSAEPSWPGRWESGSEATEDGANPSGVVSGEVVVCPQVVLRYAAEEGREANVQLGWTLIHGTLHLAGYDHETDRGEMREREQKLLRILGGHVQALALSRRDG